ncbi:MAG: hypothetical protein GF335_01265 [Candidatus Moranbacteria bacterium]|nr:hypothetical protein [Candidatus Moranbacteria bacterium]
MKNKKFQIQKGRYLFFLGFIFLIFPFFCRADLVVTSHSEPLKDKACFDKGAESFEACFNDIGDAIDAAKDGQTVIIEQGEYSQKIKIDKQLKILCKDKAIIKGDDGIGILIASDNVEINNCEIKGFQKGIATKESVADIENISILNNEIHDLKNWDDPNMPYGYGSDAIAIGHEAEHLEEPAKEDQGLIQNYFDGLNISGNTITNVYNGISLRFVRTLDYGKIVNNHIHDVRSNAILIDSSSYIDIIANTLINNGKSGIYLASSGDYGDSTQPAFSRNWPWTPQNGNLSPSGIYIQNNIIEKNGSWDKNSVYENSLANNGVAVIAAKKSIYINNNQIKDNERGITNLTDLLVEARSNYWGDDSGPKDKNDIDLNNDGVFEDPDGSDPNKNPGGTGNTVAGKIRYDFGKFVEVQGSAGWGGNQPQDGYAGDGKNIDYYAACGEFITREIPYLNLWTDVFDDGTYQRQLYYNGQFVDVFDHSENYTDFFTPLEQNDVNGGNGEYYVRIKAVDKNGNASVSDYLWGFIKPDKMSGSGLDGTWCKIKIDTVEPYVEISSSNQDPTDKKNIEIELKFNEKVYDFTSADLTVTNAEISEIKTDDYVTYILDLIASNEGLVKISIDKNSFEDEAGNLNSEKADFDLDYAVFPKINFLDGVEQEAFQKDRILISIEDNNIDASSLKYAFSQDKACDDTDNFVYNYNSNQAFELSNSELNSKYLCVKAADLAGNISYKTSSNPLNLVFENPSMPLKESELYPVDYPDTDKDNNADTGSDDPDLDNKSGQTLDGHYPIVEINSGDYYAFERKVDLEIYPPDDFEPAQMMISNDLNFTQANWEVYNSKREWELTEDPQRKTIYVKLKDTQGNVTEIGENHIVLVEEYDEEEYDEEEYDDDQEDDNSQTGQVDTYPVSRSNSINNSGNSGNPTIVTPAPIYSRTSRDGDENQGDYDLYDEQEDHQEEKDQQVSSSLNDLEVVPEESFAPSQEQESKSLVGSIFWPDSLIGKIFSLLIISGAVIGLIILTKNKLDNMEQYEDDRDQGNQPPKII